MRTIRGPSPKSEPPKFDGGLLWTQQQRASGDELMEKAIVACAYCRKRQIRCVRLSGNSDCQTCTRFDLQCDSSSRLQKAIEEASNEKLYYAFPQLLNHGKPEIRKTMVDFFNDKVPLQHATGLGSARSDLMSGTVSTTGSRPETLISDYTTSNPAPVRWTEEEDKFLLHARKSGLDWNQIQHLRFPHKTDNACRKRHERLPARRNAEEQDCPHHSLSKEESSESMPPLRLQHESVAPQVPKKIPELPQKPLAYRHSLPALSDVAALQPQQKLFTHLKPFQEQQYPQHQHGEEFNETAKSSTSEMRRLHYFENVPSSTAATGLRRAQTMRTPSRARPLESFGPRSPRDSQSFEITIRIAAVAATYVNSIPQNRDKDINGDEIRRVLEANPTLSDLCRMLRAMGVTVNEGTFADTLVRSVPDVNLLGLAKPVSLSQTRSQFKPARYRIRRPHTYIEPSTSTANWPSLPRPISDSADGGPETGSRLSYAGLSGTHEWVEQRLSKLMSDEFLRR